MDSMEHLSDDNICGAVLLLNRIALTEHEDTVVPPPIQELLGQYKDIFGTPTDLPPKRTVDHAIPFEPGAKVINQRPYRLPYHQKEAMEQII